MATALARPSLREMTDRTPATRDRYVDFLRAVSIAVVVFGHWLMAIVTLEGGDFQLDNALQVMPAFQYATWLLQVMPLFFFVGGFSHYVAWRSLRERNGTYAEFLTSRARRLLAPTLVFVGAWVTLAAILELAASGPARDLLATTSLLAKPLWFLAVYVLVVALAPAMLELHRRYGVLVVVAMAVGTAAVDIARLGFEIPLVGALNFAFVWLLPHQLGFFYADGTLTRMSTRAVGAITSAALATLVVLTHIGIYSRSMVGVVTERASNNSPPSLCLVFLTLFLVSVALLSRGRVTDWLGRARPWRVVVAANSMIMTAYLWHLTALVGAVLVIYPLGFPQPEPGSAAWWVLRPVWIALLCVALVPFVIAFGRFERAALLGARSVGASTMSAARVVPAVALLVTALAIIAQWGFEDSSQAFGGRGPVGPAVAGAALFAGYRLLTPGGPAPIAHKTGDGS